MIIKKKNLFSAVIISILALEIFLSAYLFYSPGNNSYFCSTLGSCLEVQESIYGKIFGIKIAFFGLFSFILLLFSYLFSLINKKFRALYLALALIGAFFAIYFLFIQFFILKKLCSSCIIIDALMLLLFVFSIKEYKLHNN